MSGLILHPKTVALRHRAQELRNQLAILLRKRMRLLFHELPTLRYRYHELFGQLEQEIQEKTLEMSERRRMVELFALKIDRGQTLDEKTITLTLKVVYNEFRKVREQVERIARKESHRSQGNGFQIPEREGSTFNLRGRDERGDRDELRRLYRKLAKRLHPDRCGEEDELTRTYWSMTTEGYERRDIDLLRTLSNVVETSPQIIMDARLESPAEEVLRYLELVEKEEKRLSELTSSELYTTRHRLDDDRWVGSQQQKLHLQITKLDEEIERHNRFLAPILSHSDKRITPEGVRDIWTSFVEDVYLSGRF